ncbi:MAG: polyribonucleotide nucleotidyltransferase [Candidatus Omnitrophota bacterium]|nr:MAG: polyribonucleotide nucleotidyltransferase [Candidatus Omnitrophota bacterium]
MVPSFSLPNLGRCALTFSTGELAQQANGSVVASFADTVVMVTACMSKEPKDMRGFLPLTIEYQEKTYAIGKIPGGFIKREGRPKDREILSARLIDRPLRPLFPKGLTREIQVIAMVLSSDGKNDPDVLAINGASCALFISDIPFENPVGAVRVAKVDNSLIINPTYDERAGSPLDLVVVGTEDGIVMLEGVCDQTPEEEVLKAIDFAQSSIKEIVHFQKRIKEKVGRQKQEVELFKIQEEVFSVVRDKVSGSLQQLYGMVEKKEREEALQRILSSLCEELISKNPTADVGQNDQITEEEIKNIVFTLEEEFVRKKILEEGKRPDGRSLEEIRPIECKVRVLPRTHGSAIFSRGQTQALAITTLGTSADEQFIEALEGEKSKHFMLHYTFPPFSVGEIKPLRGPSRREIGHGALAEKSLLSIVPPKEEFPYTIRVVSEILESNGSSSMATACAASLSLMDTGVPVKEPVAGIAIGLITGTNDYKVLTDIAGAEDAYGDMDFKIAGTKNGITALQLDTKIDGLTTQIIKEALARGRKAHAVILEKMNKALSLPREAVSQYAPKIKSFKIDPDKIGNVIGPGGRIIRKLTREYNVTIDIDDEQGSVSVVAESQEDLERAVNQIVNLTKDIEVGEIYDAKVTRLANFGAFCEILPGKIGLVHISEICDEFVKDVRQFLQEGDMVKVKVLSIDPQGRINLSIKQVHREEPDQRS